MFRRVLIAAVLVVGVTSWSPAVVSAQEPLAEPQLDLAPPTASFAQTPALLSAEQIQRALPAPVLRRPGGSSVMTSLYATTAVMQMLDVHSTLTAFRAGAVEANPMMQGVTKNNALFLTMKAGVAASTILAARQMAKRNKVAAIATLVAINSAYAMVVSHNYRVARSLQ